MHRGCHYSSPGWAVTHVLCLYCGRLFQCASPPHCLPTTVYSILDHPIKAKNILNAQILTQEMLTLTLSSEHIISNRSAAAEQLNIRALYAVMNPHLANSKGAVNIQHHSYKMSHPVCVLTVCANTALLAKMQTQWHTFVLSFFKSEVSIFGWANCTTAMHKLRYLLIGTK